MPGPCSKMYIHFDCYSEKLQYGFQVTLKTYTKFKKKERQCFLISLLPDIAKYSTKYFVLSKAYTDEGGIK